MLYYLVVHTPVSISLSMANFAFTTGDGHAHGNTLFINKGDFYYLRMATFNSRHFFVQPVPYVQFIFEQQCARILLC